ncbi:MAG: CaiB/BaiF CoA transferase family protein [Acidimicrobiia bacterium]
MTGLMEGVKVVETGVLMTVDFLGRLLGDEGADVVKVETPQLGDYLRNIMIRFAPDHSVFHLMLNRNKRSLTCDARTDAGKEVMAKLIADADIFITGNIGDTNIKLGLDYETVKKINPRIVYCQATGYGATGPYKEIPTHGQMMDVLGGGAPPMALDETGIAIKTGPAVESSGGVVIGPLYAAFAVAAALAKANKTGEGCFIDVSCADAIVACKWLDALPILNPEKVDKTGPNPGRVVAPIDNTATPTNAKYTFYETKDGKYLLFCAIEAKFWRNWCKATGRDDLAASHRDDLVVDFGGGDTELRLEIQKEFLKRTLAEWTAVAVEYDIAMGPALTFDQIVDDPQLTFRQQIVEDHHPVLGTFKTLGNPILVPGKEFTLRSAPQHGQHTDEVLAELGYDDGARAKLREAGVIK